MFSFWTFYTVTAYLLVGTVWCLVDMFVFNMPWKRSILMGLVWPYLAWKVKKGKKKKYPHF